MEENENRKGRKKFAWRRWILGIFLFVLILLNGIGLFFGNFLYKEISVLHIGMNEEMNEQHKDELDGFLKNHVQNKQWKDVSIESRFGYPLHGTYIFAKKDTGKTLIFLHGFSESRAAGLSYVDIYLNAGFNVLLVDSRAHGDSGGNSVTWGNYEKYDLDQWVDWVQQKFPDEEIGVHGISMGAATALMQAELNEKSKRVSFYIADSSYSDFETLLELKIEQYYPGTLLPEILLKYADVVAYFKSNFTFYGASPLRAVHHVTTPVLYIHGEADTLIPAYMSTELYDATKGPRQIYIFPHTAHIAAVFGDRDRYGEVVRNFIHFAEQRG